MIEKNVKQIIEGNTVTLTTYANHPQRKSVDVSYNPTKAVIIIIEGVVALSSELIRSMSHLKIFTTVEPGIFIKRMHAYYKWRGKTARETALLIKKRETDEYQLIEKESKLADLIINSAGT